MHSTECNVMLESFRLACQSHLHSPGTFYGTGRCVTDAVTRPNLHTDRYPRMRLISGCCTLLGNSDKSDLLSMEFTSSSIYMLCYIIHCYQYVCICIAYKYWAVLSEGHWY